MQVRAQRLSALKEEVPRSFCGTDDFITYLHFGLCAPSDLKTIRPCGRIRREASSQGPRAVGSAHMRNCAPAYEGRNPPLTCRRSAVRASPGKIEHLRDGLRS